MMGTRGRQKARKGKAVKTATGGKGAKVIKVTRAKKTMREREGGRPGRAENVRTWQKIGFTTGSAKESPRRFGEEREDPCCDAPDIDDGTKTCRNCGVVQSDLNLDYRADYSKDRNGRQIRHAEPIGDKIKGPRTLIARGNKDGKGRPLTGRAQKLVKRLRKYQMWYGSAPNRSYSEAERVRCRILDRLGFRDPRKISWEICCWLIRHKIAQGRTFEATIAAAVYVAAIQSGFPVTYAKLVECSRVSEDRLRRVVAMYLSKRPAGRDDFPVKLRRKMFFTPSRHLQHICNELDLTPPEVALAEECVQDLGRRYFSGHRPETKAAAAVKATCGDSASWKKLEQVTGVQAASLKAYWKKVVPILVALGYLPDAGDLLRDTGSQSETGL